MLRLRHRRWLAAGALAVLVAPLAPATPAAADGPCPFDVSEYGNVREYLLSCLNAFGEPGGGGGGERVCELDPDLWGIPVECNHPSFGWWSQSWQCYMQPASPQPAAGDEAWRGNGPEDGFVYLVTCPWMQGVDALDYWEHQILLFVPAGSGFLGREVDEAIGRLTLAGADIHIAPDPSGAGLVGLPVWMWTPRTSTTWSPDPVRVGPVLGWELVVEAHVDRIVWDMGNGDRVTCREPGTPYADDFGARQSPDCGYPGYQHPSTDRPDSVYPVTATTHWVIDWRFEGTAVRGQETTTRESSTTVRIHELQVVTA